MSAKEPQTPEEWSAYYDAMETKPLHPSFALLDPYLKPGLRALDLGCGVGHGAIHLLQRGLEVLAVDTNKEALARLKARLPEGLRPTLIDFDFRALDLATMAFDVVVAGFSLFFLSPEEFRRFWPKVVGALRVDGLFMGQFLGVHDDWAGGGYSTHTAEDVRRLFAPFEILSFEEVEREGETAQGGAKHWHVFHVLARKL